MTAQRSRRETVAEQRARRAGVDDVDTVLGAAARILETRSRSVAEVRRRLTGAGYRGPLVDEAVARLLELGLLDDMAFARAWVESRDRARPRGEHALRGELALKGVDRVIVDEVIAERRGEGSGDSHDGSLSGRPPGLGARGDSGGDGGLDPDRAAADRLLARRRAALQREPDSRVRTQRAYALLARNGFSPDVCREASRSFVDGDPEAEADGL